MYVVLCLIIKILISFDSVGHPFFNTENGLINYIPETTLSNNNNIILYT